MKKLFAVLFTLAATTILGAGCAVQSVESDDEAEIGQAEQAASGLAKGCCKRFDDHTTCHKPFETHDQAGNVSHFCRADEYTACCDATGFSSSSCSADEWSHC